jgi:hypothetical protein
MKRLFSVLIALPLVLSLVTGCATTDRTRTQGEGTMVGAAAGALLGGLIGAATGNSDDALVGAAIGAAVGGAAGYVYGTHVANQKEKYASREDWLDACIANVAKVNQETREYNIQLARDIHILETEATRLREDYNKRIVQKSALLEEKEKMEVKLAMAKEKLELARYEKENQEKVLAEAKQTGSNVYVKDFEVKIAELTSCIDELEKQTAVLASLSQDMTV